MTTTIESLQTSGVPTPPESTCNIYVCTPEVKTAPPWWAPSPDALASSGCACGPLTSYLSLPLSLERPGASCVSGSAYHLNSVSNMSEVEGGGWEAHAAACAPAPTRAYLCIADTVEGRPDRIAPLLQVCGH